MIVSLLRFLHAGEFGELCVGMSRQEVGELLGPPDYTGGETRKHRYPTIYVYDYLEIYFGYETPGKLWGFMVDGMKAGPFQLGSRVTLHDWELALGDTASVVREYLTRHNILFRELPNEAGAYRLRTADERVEITFNDALKLETISCVFERGTNSRQAPNGRP